MKKNGFTVLELVTTFALIAIIATLLTQIIVSLNNLFNYTNIKTELYHKQSLISKAINNEFSHSISYINSCGTNCIQIIYSDYTRSQIKIENNLIYIGDNTYEIEENSKLGDIKMDIVYSPVALEVKDDTIFNIKIPILYDKKDYGINFVYQYNRTRVNITL